VSDWKRNEDNTITFTVSANELNVYFNKDYIETFNATNFADR